MESTVTRLLVATKQLLESLTEWSHGKIDEGGVSDIYVRLGNEFNAASLAFTKEGIDMKFVITLALLPPLRLRKPPLTPTRSTVLTLRFIFQ